MSQSVETRGLDELDDYFAGLQREFPKKKKEFLATAGAIIREDVAENIAESVNDSQGHVQSWQKAYIGSGGGYAAVRAIGTEDGGESGPNGPGAITNYLENGHKTRPSSGNAKRLRRGRAKQAYVDGSHFYDESRSTVESKLIAAAEGFMDSVAGEG